MASFQIIPRDRVYLIERTSPEGVKEVVERHNTENAALTRLNKLRQKFDPEFRIFTSSARKDD